MSVTNPQILFDNTSSANYRSWGSAVNAALAAVGWVQTADTGQVNWTTVTVPASGIFNAFEIWKANDALAAACPIFIRIDYGSNSAGTLGPNMKVQVGTGSNGTGTLTGNTTTAVTVTAVAAGTGATTYDCYVSGDGGGRLGMMLWRNFASGTPQFFFGIERSLDANGNYTSSYFSVVTLGNNTAAFYCIQPVGSGTLFQTASSLATMPTLPNTVNPAAYGGNAPIFPLFPVIGRVDNPLTIIGKVMAGDQTEGTQFNVQMYGATRNMVFTKQSVANIGLGSNGAYAMRYD